MAIDLALIEDWLRFKALPFWATAGRDGTAGGYFDHVTSSGAPLAGPARDAAPKRTRVQARQLYVYCHAALLGLDDQATARADHAYDFMIRHLWHPQGGWIYATDRQGNQTDLRTNLYEQAFALYALAWYYQLTKKPEAGDWIARTVAFIDGRLVIPGTRGFANGLPATLPRQQNPHMHLLEAWLAMHAVSGAGDYLNRATALITLFERHLFDPQSDTLGEFYDADWRPAAGIEGQIVEPGHHFEWCWLLAQYGEAANRDMSDYESRLYDFAARHGTDSDGLVVDALLRDGSVQDDNRRLWVQTEALKAACARYERDRDTAAAERAETLLQNLFEKYLDRETGHWREHLDRAGQSLRDRTPASSFYHVFLALTEVLRVFR